ncbi:MAG: hypothetical protein ACRD1I_00180 [Terriglobia bacterium]
MTKGRYLLIGALICLLAFLSAGCETMNPEWSGNMPNENGRHVQPQDLDAPSQNNSDAIRPLALMRAWRVLPSSAAHSDTRLNGLMGQANPRVGFARRGLPGIWANSLTAGGASGAAILPFKNVRLTNLADAADPAKP